MTWGRDVTRTTIGRACLSLCIGLLAATAGLSAPDPALANTGPAVLPDNDTLLVGAAAQRTKSLQVRPEDAIGRLDDALADIHVDLQGTRAVAFVREGADAVAIGQAVAALQPDLEAFALEAIDGFARDRAWLRQHGYTSLLGRVDTAERTALDRHARVLDLVRAVSARPNGAQAALLQLKETLAGYAPPKATPLTAEAMRREMDIPRARAPLEDAASHRAWVGKAAIDAAPAGTPPVADDLGETPEVVLTERIRAKAAELGHSPVAIYNYVRNTVRFVPGYGAAQSADFTLLNGQGTQFDIATLLIALLRASDVPARYATGKIGIPAERAKRWMEPVRGAADAVELLQVSGTPSIGRVVNGVVEEVQLEHVWVEAWLDYEPSRGAVQREGDTWVPMDASFKQHTVTREQPVTPDPAIGQAIDAIWDQRQTFANGAFTRFDLNAASDALYAFGADIVPADGVSGDYRPRVDIVPVTVSSFPASLPYHVFYRSAGYANLPDSLRYRVHVQALRGGGNQLFPVNFSEVFSKTYPLAAVGTDGFNIDYVPVDQTVTDAMNTLRRENPTQLSPYMLDLAPVLLLGDVIDEILTPIGMGETEQWAVSVIDPAGLRPEARPFQWTAGTYAHIAIDAFGHTQAALDEALPEALEGQVVNSRTFLQSAGLGYWAGHDRYREVSGEAFGGRIIRLPSVGAFYKPMTVSYFFGVPRNGSYVGYTTDVLTTVGATAPDQASYRNMMLAFGSWGSFLESLIWDVQIGLTPGTGSSSTSILVAANESGIPIHEITQDNFAQVFPLLQLDQESLTEIRNAVQAGMVILTPETEVSIAGQPAVAGYLIRDPETGTGISRISGSLNGALVVGCLAEAISLDAIMRMVMMRMIERMLAPLIARGVLVMAAVFALGPIGVAAATAISVVTLICAAMTLLKFAIDIATGGFEQALCNLVDTCAGRKGRAKLEDMMKRGNPILPEVGMKFLTETDYEGNGPFPLRFQRTYLSGGIGDNGMSPGWNMPYFTEAKAAPESGESFVRLEVLEPGQPFALPPDPMFADIPAALLFLRESGGYFQFNRVGDAYFPPSNHSARIRSAGTGAQRRWTYLADDDVSETYDDNGRLLTLADRNGVTQTLVYSGSGQLTEVRHSLGRSLRFGYGPLGRLETLTDPDNRVTRYEYEDFHLVRVIHHDGTSRRYHYEDERYPDHITGVTDERGIRTVTAAYDYRGRAIETTGPDGSQHYRFRYGEGVYTEIDPLGTEREFRQTSVEGIWRITSSAQPCGACGGTDTAERSYDARGYVATDTDFNGNETRYVHDERGLITSVTQAAGTPLARTVTTQWHPDWRVETRIVEPSATGGQRITTQTVDDDNGNVLTRNVTVDGVTRTWTYTWNDDGQLLTEDGPRTDVQDVTTYTYDVRGDRKTMRNPLGHLTTFDTYDAGGQLLQMTDPNGLVTEFEYDERDRLSETRVGRSGTTLREITHYAYDDAGNMTRITQPDGSFIEQRYDDAGRLERVGDSLGNHVDYTYNAVDQRSTERTHDADDALVQAITTVHDALGRIGSLSGADAADAITFGYDPNGNQTQRQVPGHAQPSFSTYDALDRLESNTDATGATEAYTYDARDNLRTFTDGRDLTTTYGYNGFDELLTQLSPDTGSTSYLRDAAGNPTRQTDARDVAVVNTHDAADRITSATYPDELVTYTYDAAVGGAGALGQLTSASTAARNGSGIDATQVAMTYDAHGRVTRTSQSVGSSAALAIDIEHDDDGRRAGMTLPSGAQITYGYGADGRILRILVNGVEIVGEIEYFPMGQPKAWNHGSVGRYERDYDDDGRVREHSLGAGARALDYDLAGRITEIADTAAGQSDWTYGYDDADRLDAASNAAAAGPTAGRAYAWQFDDASNRIEQRLTQGAAIETTTYVVADDSNQLDSVGTAAGGARSYDAVGNAVRWRAEAGTFAGSQLTAGYSGRNRLRTLNRVDGGGEVRIARYAYNAMGERVAKWTGAAASQATAQPTHRYVYADGQIAGEYGANGALANEYIWLDDEPVAVLRPAGSAQGGFTAGAVDVYFIHPDHLGTPRVVVNAAGAEVWRWESSPFGETPAQQNPSGLGAFVFDLRFAGQQYDAESGAHYNYQRDYDATTGRYLQSDPLGLFDGPNSFAYVGSSPLDTYDEEGLSRCNRNLRALGLCGKPKVPPRPITIPSGGGVYLLINCHGMVVYVGKATSFASRMNSHRNSDSGQWRAFETPCCPVTPRFLSAKPARMGRLELQMIRRYKPPGNVQHNPTPRPYAQPCC